MIGLEILSNASGAVLFSILLVLLIINWRGQYIGGILILSCVMSVLFFSSIAFNASSGMIPLAYIRYLEVARDICWLVFLFSVVYFQSGLSSSMIYKYIFPGIMICTSLFMLIGITSVHQLSIIPGLENIEVESLFYGFLMLSFLGLLLIEQVFRRTRPQYRWGMKYLCLGLGAIFAYDFFLYTDAVLFRRINPDFWYTRGAVNAVCVPLIAVSIKRIREWKMEIFISRHVILQSSMLMIAGIYLSFMAISGYYVKLIGDSWGSAIQTVFIFTASLGLLVLLFSNDIRARLKIFLAKHFYENKYDYREEWLGFTRNLSDVQYKETKNTEIVKLFAKVMKCQAGGIWLRRNDDQYYICQGVWNLDITKQKDIHQKAELMEFLKAHEWVINVFEFHANKSRYHNIQLPPEIREIDEPVLIIPLMAGINLLGIILLNKTGQISNFNWEDYDLLKTMGRQAANFISQNRLTEDLAEAKQFEAFNRLSAYVVHDMKNITAQLSLISSNAKKFKDNQNFIDDAFDTIDNAVSKMSRMTRNLKKDALKDVQIKELLDIKAVISEVINSRKANLPVPTLLSVDIVLNVLADRDRLSAVLEHLVQNAQEATDDNGRVEISLSHDDKHVRIVITDTGSGMDDDFIKNRLYRPFDTTKGNAGMGIGVYESREVIEELGGDIKVKSIVGTGTVFTIQLPLSLEEESVQNNKYGRLFDGF